MSPAGPEVVALVAAAPDADAAARGRAHDVAQAIAARTGGVLLATCHRVELYLRDDPATRVAILEAARHGLTIIEGASAARRLVEVAVGLRSAVLAEDQLIHQLREAVTQARRHGPLGRDLERLADAALRAGRTARSWRPATAGGTRSLADVAIARIAATGNERSGLTILVVGTGVMGRAVGTAAARAGMSIRSCSRTDDHARVEAARIGGIAWPIDPGADLATVDGVVVALSGPWRLGRVGRAALAECPAVIDLSMPPALAPSLRARLAGRLTDIDALAVDTPAGEPGEAVMVRFRARLERLVDTTVAGYLDDTAARRRSGAERLATRVEHQRAATLDAYLRRRADGDPELRHHLDEVTRDLSRRILQEPLRRLAEDPDGRRGRALDELFGA